VQVDIVQNSDTLLSGDLLQSINLRKRIQRTCGFVPVHVANLSLENIELNKGAYVGEASPIHGDDIDNDNENLCSMYTIQGVEKLEQKTALNFNDYLRDKLQHLTEDDQRL